MSTVKKVLKNGRRDIISDKDYCNMKEGSTAGDFLAGVLFFIGMSVLVVLGVVTLINVTMC